MRRHKEVTMAKPKTQDLPGMEDRAIKPLQEAALEYAGIRDQRMALNTQEADLKKRVRTLMHKHKPGQTRYAYDGVEIELVPPEGEEGVKVRIKKLKEDGEAPAA
jgi:Zn/Cd-binding protein ZinT